MTTILSNNQITKLLDQYKCLADQTYDIFAVECDIIFTDIKTAVPIDPDNNIPDLNSVNSRRRRPAPNEQDIANQTVISSGVSEKIDIKIYWNAKEWQTIYGYTSVPENHVMFLAKIDKADELNQATQVRFTDVASGVHLFNRVSRAVPYGFEKDKYCSSIWEEVQ